MQELTPPPLLAYMHAKTTVERDVAYLRLYAEKIRNRSETIWEIPNTRAATVEDIAKRFEAHYRQAEATVTALRQERDQLRDLREQESRLYSELSEREAALWETLETIWEKATDNWAAQCFDWTTMPEVSRQEAQRVAREGFDELCKLAAVLQGREQAQEEQRRS